MYKYLRAVYFSLCMISTLHSTASLELDLLEYASCLDTLQTTGTQTTVGKNYATTLSIESGHIIDIAFSPHDTNTLAIAIAGEKTKVSFDGTRSTIELYDDYIELWHYNSTSDQWEKSLKKLHEFIGFYITLNRQAHSMAWSPDGKYIITPLANTQKRMDESLFSKPVPRVMLWNTNTMLQTVIETEPSYKNIKQWTWLNNNTCTAILPQKPGKSMDFIYITQKESAWYMTTNTLNSSIELGNNPLYTISPDLIATHNSEALFLITLDTPAIKEINLPYTVWKNPPVLMHGSGTKIALLDVKHNTIAYTNGSYYTVVNLIDIDHHDTNSKNHRSIDLDREFILDIALSPRGDFIAIATNYGQIVLYNTKNLTLYKTLKTSIMVTRLSWNAKGTHLAAIQHGAINATSVMIISLDQSL